MLHEYICVFQKADVKLSPNPEEWPGNGRSFERTLNSKHGTMCLLHFSIDGIVQAQMRHPTITVVTIQYY